MVAMIVARLSIIVTAVLIDAAAMRETGER